MQKSTTSGNRKFFSLLFFAFVLIYGCASMRTPEGGPKDATPPKILKMEPKNFSTNFNAQKITIDFDEYFNIVNEFKEVSVSPDMEKPPVLKKRQRKLEVTFPDSLEKNTTYTINFGNAIVDVNEGNVLKNFTYVFSTGPKLDSLSISGTVINTLTGKPELDATVFILPLDRDSIFGKKKPSIFTTTDSSGHYKLNNLREDKYKIYALKESGGDKIYQQATDEIGFLKDTIVLKKNIENIDLGIFKELATKFRIIDRRLNNDGSIFMSFNQQLINPQLTVIEPKAIDDNKITRFTKQNDSVKLWLKDLSFDSVKIAINTAGKPLDTVTFTRGKKDTYTRVIQATDNLSGDGLSPYVNYKLTFNMPIDKVDLSKITLLDDSIPRTNFTLDKDTSDILSYIIKYPWAKKREYNLTFAEGAFTEIFGTKNKEFKKMLTLGSPDDYGTLVLNVEVPEANKNYVVEIVNDKKQVIFKQAIAKNGKINLTNFKSGIYFARVIYDENKNGKWDTGNVAQQLQPEKIWYKKEELSIRSNWERVESIAIPKPEVP